MKQDRSQPDSLEAEKKRIEAEKKRIRAAMSAMRCALPADVRAGASRDICAQLQERLADLGSGPLCVAVYMATADEIDLGPFIRFALAQSGVRLAAPRWNGAEAGYGLAELGGCGTVPGRMGILEPPAAAPAVGPQEVDLWIAPGLAFTMAGARLGYGGGHYDRFFAAANARIPHAARLGVAYGFQVLESLPAGPHDMMLDGVVVPRN